MEINHDNIVSFLRELNAQNWGSWDSRDWPILVQNGEAVGYTCNQYDCGGKTATAIKFDKEVSLDGEKGRRFVYGAPRTHLPNYIHVR